MATLRDHEEPLFRTDSISVVVSGGGGEVQGELVKLTDSLLEWVLGLV